MFPVLRFTVLALTFGIAGANAADLLAQAFGSLPANVVSVERDKLSQLRTLPNYASLQQMYSGRTFEEARKAIGAVGIAESDLQEVVIAFNGTAYYGLASGLFDTNKARGYAAAKGWQALKESGVELFCSAGASTCLAFPAQSLLAFGTAEQIKQMIHVRIGREAALRSNRALMSLLALADRNAPVMGVAPGAELKSWIGDAVPSELMSQERLTKSLRTIEFFQYNVHFDGKAHLSLNLQCNSSIGANTLSAALNTLSGIQAIGSSLGSESLPFEHMSAHAAGILVSLQLDAPIPTQ